ncbi:MAG TPA: 30S ribosomal protein S8 [Candidatus Paceibacterota bacterium]|nr:30S ribosomal protein S8 [Candidatus Paceibacterota bacterium]
MYYNLLSQLKNAGQAKKESLLLPFSKMDFAVAKVLAETGYAGDVQKKTFGRREFIEVRVRRGKNGPVLNDFKILSKPSRRLYIGYENLKPVKQGYGIAVISTPNGVMSNKQARKQKVGGEYLFEIW